MTQRQLEKVYDEHFDAVYNFIYYRVRNMHEAEDITADIFHKVVKYADSYSKKEGATVRSWVFAIARNTLTDHFRTKKEHADIENMDIAKETELLDTKISKKQDIDVVFEALSVLSDQQQELITLKYRVGLQNKEIAEVLGIEPKSVSSALSKAIKKLRTAVL